MANYSPGQFLFLEWFERLQLFQGSSYSHHPRYYYDDAVISYGAGRSMLPVSLHHFLSLNCNRLIS